MDWKKRIVSNDLISYEKRNKSLKVVIEARHSHEQGWEVFKIYNYQKKNFIEEYSVYDKSEAKNLISKLKKERDLTVKQISDLDRIKSEFNMRVKREYKSENIEKWLFRVNDQKFENFFVVHQGDDLTLDLVICDKYRLLEKDILEEIANILNIDMIEGECTQNVYFYSSKSEYHTEPSGKNEVVFGHVMFDYNEE